MAHHFESYRRNFENLDWSRGYTWDELRSRYPDFPWNDFHNAPTTQRFHSFHDEDIEKALTVQFGAHPYPFSPERHDGAPGIRP